MSNNNNQSKNPNQQQNQNQSQQKSVVITQVEDSVMPGTVSAVLGSQAQVNITSAPLEVRLIPTPEKMRRVRPRSTVNRMKIGPTWYQFEKGKEVVVPEYVAQHLEEKGII